MAKLNPDSTSRTAVVIGVGPGLPQILDTLDSVQSLCREPMDFVFIDDFTQDGCYEALVDRFPNGEVIRNSRRHGYLRLAQSLAKGYRRVLEKTNCDLILRLDQDALVTGVGILSDAATFARANPSIGLFGVYSHDYNRPRNFEMHARRMNSEMHWIRRLVGLTPCWARILDLAEKNGYQRGDNVFGGAYFFTRPCLEAMNNIGALDIPYWAHTRVPEDVYFSIATVAAGYKLGHFGAPEGPMCLEWRGLPHPASDLLAAGYKIVHSVDKGANTDRTSNGGKTAREVFREARQAMAEKAERYA